MNASDMKGVTYGCSMKKVKHEDAHLLKLGTDSALFGVFDGHGGGGISFACAERLAPLVGKARNTDEVEDAFWHFDATIGPKLFQQGSTVTILRLREEKDGGVGVLVAWVGDSRLMQMDMLALEPAYVFSTSVHHADHPDEERRIGLQWAARERLEQLDNGVSVSLGAGEDTAAVEAKARMREQAAHETCKAKGAPDSLVAPLARALEYEERVTQRCGQTRAGLRREQSVYFQRKRQPGAGITFAPSPAPLAVQAVWFDEEAGQTVSGASTVNTRAIGDWDGSRVCVPQPEVAMHAIKESDYMRFVLASDGLWEVLGRKSVARIVYGETDPQDAAAKLAMAAKRAWNNHPNLGDQSVGGDDLTILIIDVCRREEVRAGAVARRGAKGAAAGCSCTVS